MLTIWPFKKKRRTKSQDSVIIGMEDYLTLVEEAKQANKFREENQQLHHDIRLMPLPGDPRRRNSWERPFVVGVECEQWRRPELDEFVACVRFSVFDVARWYGKSEDAVAFVATEIARELVEKIRDGF